MSLTTHAQSWATYQSELTHLSKLIEQGNLNAQQVNTIDDHINYLHEELEQLESYILDNHPESYYYNMRELAHDNPVNPSPEFLDHINSILSQLNMNDTDFAIHTAIEQYNSFYYGCSILISPTGHIYFDGIDRGNQPDVLFNKGVGYHTITILDIHNKLNHLQPA